ncbi:NAD-dependent epimerase/dehydratase family protein [Rhodoferax sp.]|uniref:NAD-dependent epimerase/dehydratase family protein n=1 Tax=Rhodoferax sp. TaxID=50421 RepID=UPI002ACEAA66|nr:NAD-dependent epimerase/dehydratase family protein [Rhodoferax sp.]MDZ7922003.1 NAD-dependent epimerase/dehydratase family protein [Rhodoferax sp.]
MRRVWVLGGGGMLGAALSRELHQGGAHVYRYRESFDWKTPQHVRQQFDAATQEFLSGLSAGDDWEIYWAAGVGSMGSSKADLDGETFVLGEFLGLLAQGLQQCGVPGMVGFASSAGALYAGSQDFEITECTAVTVINDYAAAKLAQERLFEDFASRIADVRVLLARFSTLYGPGQAQGKRQGLLSHIARCALRHQPVEIFVPLDTSRDYLFVEDAASGFIVALQALRAQDKRTQVKIVAAERSVTISEIIATFNRLNKRRLRIVCNRNNLSAMYARRVAYRSVSPLGAAGEICHTTLLEGAAALLRVERMTYIAGSNKG